MKKIFYLLLFITSILQAQNGTTTLQPKGSGVTKLNISANPEKTTAPRVLVQETNGDVGYVAKSTLSQVEKQTKLVRNQTGSTLTKGTIVYQSSVANGKLLVAKALASVGFMSDTTLGIIENDIPNNSDGTIVILGNADGIDTSSFPNGSILYLSDITAGQFTTTIPSADSHIVKIGVITNSATSGSIDIKIEKVVLQVNSDWNATSGPAKILNKPTIPSIVSPTFTGNVRASGFEISGAGSNYLLANGTTTPYSSGIFSNQLSIVGSSIVPTYSENATTISTQANSISFGTSSTKQFNITYNDIQEQTTLSIPNISGGYGELAISKYTHNSINAVPRFTSSKMLEKGHIWDTSVGVGISSDVISVFSPSYLFQLQLDSAAKPSTNTWTIASDSRLKENIQNYTKGLSAILSIRPVTYDYNGKAGFSKIKGNIGVIAQEVQNIVPEGVSTFSAKLNPTDTSETMLYNFNSHAITYILINAIKELNQKITDLQAEVQILKSK